MLDPFCTVHLSAHGHVHVPGLPPTHQPVVAPHPTVPTAILPIQDQDQDHIHVLIQGVGVDHQGKQEDLLHRLKGMLQGRSSYSYSLSSYRSRSYSHSI